MTVAADNVDPRGVCQDKGAASCGTNGKCDGTGSCATYAKGTVCASETCASGVYTAASTCNTTGQCVAPDSRPCAPFVCNGSQCFNVCATSDQRKSPNTCNAMNSCGLKGPGAVCAHHRGVPDGPLLRARATAATPPAAEPASRAPSLARSGPARTFQPIRSIRPRSAWTSWPGQRQVRRHRQLRDLRQGRSAPARPARAASTRGVDVQHDRPVRRPRLAPLRPLRLQRLARASTSARRTTSARRPTRCNAHELVRAQEVQAPSAPARRSARRGLSCAQGYCCNSPCGGACQSCALPNSLGTCTNVPANQVDPSAQCVDKLAALLQHQRQVRRQRQLPALRAGDDLPRVDLPRRDLDLHRHVDL